MTDARLDVLIVEDEKWLGEHFARVLHRAGYSTTVTTNGMAAMNVIDQSKPKVLVVDMLLSGGTVMPLLHELQSYDDTGRIPVILCTNLAADMQLKDLKTYGVRRILDKTTMHPDDISVAVRSVML